MYRTPMKWEVPDEHEYGEIVVPDNLHDTRGVFEKFDSKGDGKIGAGQVADVLRALGQNPTNAEVKTFLRGFSEDARVAFEQFLPIYLKMSKEDRDSMSVDQFIEGFSSFENEQSGRIQAGTLRFLLTTLGEKLTDEEADTLLDGLPDDRGSIYTGDFVRSVVDGGRVEM